MPNNSDNYNLLLRKIDEFTRRYYVNKLLRGLIYTGAVLLAVFLLLSVSEYFMYSSANTRKALFYSYIALAAVTIGFWVVRPLLQYFKLGTIISYDQAAKIIGLHFTEVQDKLLNILQLQGQNTSSADASLINASIDQKIDNLKPIPFTAAVDLRENRRYLKYLAVPVVVFLLILFNSPGVITESTARLYNNSTEFERPAPFIFLLQNEQLKTVQGEDVEILVKIEGEVLPTQVAIKQGQYSYRMEKRANNLYAHTFFDLQKTNTFSFSASGFNSKPYTIDVLAKPSIVSFETVLDYPKYTKRADETLRNIGDLNVPEGTQIRWRFNTKNTESVSMSHIDTSFVLNRRGTELFEQQMIAKRSLSYTLSVSNKELQNADSIQYGLTVIPDQYPSISITPYEDSLAGRYLYFIGELADDYGLSSLRFWYKVDNKDKKGDYTNNAVSFERNGALASFSHYVDLRELQLKPGDELTYYFQVWDNDGVNGSKSSKSAKLQYKLASINELEEKTDQNNEQIKDQMASAMEKAEDLRNDLKKMQEKLIEKKKLGWEDKKLAEDLLEKQKSLEKDIESLKEQFANNNEQQEQYKKFSPELVKKQEKLSELFDELMSEEMKKMFEEMQAMMEEMDKEQLMENLEDFELSEEEMEKELDRMLSLFKQLELEQKMEETIDQLEELAKDQEELAEDTKEGNKSDEELAMDQKELNERFDQLKEKLDDLEKLSEEAENPMDMSDAKEDGEEVQNEMQKSQESLDKGKNQKASESQKSAAQKMQEMAESMQSMMGGAQMEQMAMDMQMIRQLLENLITLSFDEERLMDEIRSTSVNDPKYVGLIQQQYKIKDDSKLVEDSLFALSKRVFQLESFINDEIRQINRNIESSIALLADRKKGPAQVKQQLIMTGYNNLALMLDEVMQQMQQQMAQQMQGPPKNCQGDNPGNSQKPGQSKSMSQMQKDLNQQMKDMQEGKQKGGQKPGGKQGSKPGGGSGMSKEMAQMAAKQAAIRDAMRKLAEQESKQGPGSMGSELKEMMDQMDKTETDLVNKKLTNEMLQRQEQILVRLLETEEAIREREMDNKRKSQTGDEIARDMPPSLEEYLKKRDAEIQLYKTVPPSLRPFYRNMVESYFKSISF